MFYHYSKCKILESGDSMKILRNIRNKLCGIAAFFMVYVFASIVWVTEDKENLMIVLLFLVTVITLLVAAYLPSNIEHILHSLKVPQVV